MPQIAHNKTFRIGLELWSFDESELQILCALQSPLLPPRFALQATTWKGGDSKRSRPRDVIDFIGQLKKLERFNEAFLKFSFEPYLLLNTKLILTGIELRLRISPTSAKWESPYGHQSGNRSSQRMRMFHESLERSLKWNGVQSCPTVLEAGFVMEGWGVNDEFYPHFGQLLAGSLSSVSLPSLLGCAYRSMHSNFGLYERLAPWPNTYPFLQARFDKLHPVLVGPATLCKNLSKAIQSEKEKYSLPQWQANNDLCVLLIPDQLLQDEKAMSLAAPFIVDRPSDGNSVDTTKDHIESGDQRFGPALFHTFRRYKQLVIQGLLPSSDDAHCYFPLIADAHCRLIGVDPNDMLVTHVQNSWAQEVRSAAASLLAEIPSELAPKERLSIAYEQIYRERYQSIPGLFEPLWKYMKEAYFE